MYIKKERQGEKDSQFVMVVTILPFAERPTCHDFLLLQTALRKGNNDGIPSADATTANALAVVLRTYLNKITNSC